VVSIIAPGGLGYLGVLEHHAPLLTTLGSGRLQVRERPGREFVFQIAGGFLEVSSNAATILADRLELLSAPEGERLDGQEGQE